MTGRRLWAGVDAGADRCQLSVVDEDLSPVFEESLPSDPVAIAAALEALGETIIMDIAVESGASSVPLAHGLRHLGFSVSVLHTAQVHRFLRLRRNKTDSSDARGLAELAKLRLPSLKLVHLKSPETQRLRSRLQFRHRLTLHRVACEGMIRSLFRLNGGRLKRSQSGPQLARNVEAEASRLREERGIDLFDDVAPLLDLVLSMRRYLKSTDAAFTALAEDHPVCSRFLAIPGVGPLTAISFYSAIEDPWRFRRASDVGPYLGLTPIVLQSGMSLRHGRISKMGSRLTRSHLVNAATVMFAGRVRDCPLREWGLAVAARAGTGKARIAVARRLAVIMLAMWRGGRAYDAALAAPRIPAHKAPLTADDRDDPEVRI